MNLEEAKAFLSTCNRWELRDHAFGDVEVGWTLNRIDVANGYFGASHASVSIDTGDSWVSFNGDEARALREMGTLLSVERNDETGPDTYTEGVIMPGLTKEGVLEELTERTEK